MKYPRYAPPKISAAARRPTNTFQRNATNGNNAYPTNMMATTMSINVNFFISLIFKCVN